MDEKRVNRRGFLAAAGAGVLGAVAGCMAPQASQAGTQPSFPDNLTESTTEVDPDGRAEDSAYTDVYESIIDSVTFLRVFGIESPFTEETGQGQGSGFLYDDTHVVTNEHVVYGGEDVDVRYPTDEWANTEVVGTDFYSDLAVLEVDHVPDAAEPLALTEANPAVGQEVLAIGNPFGLEGTMTKGIVSGVDRSLEVGAGPGQPRSFPNVVQFDAGVNPGNSGGPLVNLDGDVVGVVNAGGGENIGFAISAPLARRVVPALIDDGEYHHPFIGVVLETVDRVVAEENDLPEPGGVIVVDVGDDTPAGGVLQGSDDSVTRHGEPVPIGGDVIVELDGHPIPDRNALSAVLTLELRPGDTVPLELRRDGALTTVELTLGERPPAT